MEQTLLKQFKILKYYSVALTVIVICGFAFVFTNLYKKPKFKEIDVERINIIEKNGELKMVISNDEMQHPGTVDGKLLPARKRSAGIIFFNTEGDECGGLIYDGNKKSAGLALSVDKYKNDQIMQLQYNEEANNGKAVRSYGLKLWDRPDNFTSGQLIAAYDSLVGLKSEEKLNDGMRKLKEQGLLGQDRMFVGKNVDNQVGIFIKDKQGRQRIKLYVDDNNKVIMQALDEKGREVR